MIETLVQGVRFRREGVHGSGRVLPDLVGTGDETGYLDSSAGERFAEGIEDAVKTISTLFGQPSLPNL